MTEDKKDESLETDFSTNEFDEIYSDDDDDLASGLEDVSQASEEETVEEDSSLDFIEEDIEEIYTDSSEEENQDQEEPEEEDIIDASSEEEDDDSPAPVVKKKSSFGSILILLILILGGGAGAYFSGMIPGVTPISLSSRSYEQPNLANNSAGDSMQQEETMAAEASGESDNVSELDDLYDDNYGEADQYEAVLEPQIDEQNQEVFFEIADDDDSSEQGFLGEAENDPIQPVVGEEVSNVEVQDALPSVDETVQESMPVASNVQMDGALADQLNMLNSELKTLQSNVARDINNLKSSMSSQQPASQGDSVSSKELLDIKTSLDKLTQRLDDIEGKVNNTIEEISELQKSSKSKPSAPVASSSKKVTSVAAPKKKAAPSVSWEIRAIQVGKAVIARKGQGETRDIAVGDNVPGLGTIKDINFNDGRWVIVGSSRTIKQ